MNGHGRNSFWEPVRHQLRGGRCRDSRENPAGARDTVSRNKPYAGGFITEHYGNPAAGLHAIQLEINRALYMDERRYQRSSTFARLAGDMETLASRTRLHSRNSLLTGKLTGNFVKFACWARFCTPTYEQIQRLAAKFPTQPNREFLQKNREFVQENREFESSSRAAFQTMFSEGPRHSSATATATPGVVWDTVAAAIGAKKPSRWIDGANCNWASPSRSEPTGEIAEFI